MGEGYRHVAVLLTALSTTPINVMSASAQVVPDNTLGNESSSVSGIEEVRITGGVERGENLFHSFEQFSIPEGTSAIFDNTMDVRRIFSRVTGGEPSVINGLITSNGSADLYLLNSAGISFLPRAELDIGGSFIGTTASFVEFADGEKYFSAPSTEKPILTSNIPVGLGFLEDSSISVQNSGHSFDGGLSTPLIETEPVVGLTVSPGNAIALLGANVEFIGGVVRAPDGQIEIGAVQDGFVEIDSSISNFDYDARLGALQLSERSALDVRGSRGGSISTTAQKTDVSTGSILYAAASNNSFQSSKIKISSAELAITGPATRAQSYNDTAAGSAQSTPSSFSAIRSGAVLIDNYGVGQVGDIVVEADTVSLSESGLIYQRAFGLGSPGNISITSGSLLLDAPAPELPGVLSAIATTNLGSSSAQESSSGDISVKTNSLRLLNGGLISTSTVGQGRSGDIEIEAKDISISSISEPTSLPASISSGSLLFGPTLDTGDAGAITISTDRLNILEGGTIISSSNSLGDAGSISIYADEVISIDGVSKAGIPSQVSSESIELTQPIREFFSLSSNPTGKAGRVFVETPLLRLSNGGRISVKNDGTGDAGDLSITAKKIDASLDSRITANTSGGEGGNINISSSLFLLDSATVDATAAGNGKGGNVSIDGDAIVLLNSSTVSANADQGTGGQVRLSSDVLLRSPNSSITATSSAGVALDGSVDIRRREEVPQSETETKPSIEVPSVTAVCVASDEEGEFTVSGRGGTGISRDEQGRVQSGWNPTPSVTMQPQFIPAHQIVEAQGWVADSSGMIRLVSQTTDGTTLTQNNSACIGKAAS